MGLGEWRKGAFLGLVVMMSGACSGESDADVGPFEGATWFTEGPEMRIGAVDDPDFAFSSVLGLALGPDQHLYSLHRNEGSARRWSLDGQPAGTVGREGDGPGEFRRPGKIGFFGDTLWIMDTYAYRVSFFDLDGTYFDRLGPEVDIGGVDGSPPRPESPLRDGTFMARAPGWSSTWPIVPVQRAFVTSSARQMIRICPRSCVNAPG